jgi:hypothetical protein
LTVDMTGSISLLAELLRLSRLNDGEMVPGCAGFLSMVWRCSLESPQRFRWASSICLLRRSCSSSITVHIDARSCEQGSPVDPVLWLSVSRVPSKAGIPGADSPLERERLSTESSYTTSSSSSSESLSIGGGIMHCEYEVAAGVLSLVLFEVEVEQEGAFWLHVADWLPAVA